MRPRHRRFVAHHSVICVYQLAGDPGERLCWLVVIADSLHDVYPGTQVWTGQGPKPTTQVFLFRRIGPVLGQRDSRQVLDGVLEKVIQSPEAVNVAFSLVEAVAGDGNGMGKLVGEALREGFHLLRIARQLPG